jgi:hypothetical protein
MKILLGFVVTMFVILWAQHSPGHDLWISKEMVRNKNGEWCCNEHDCEAISAEDVHERRDGFDVRLVFAANPPLESRIERRFIPRSQAQESKDGKYWHCRRPDRTTRCFFFPPPSM